MTLIMLLVRHNQDILRTGFRYSQSGTKKCQNGFGEGFSVTNLKQMRHFYEIEAVKNDWSLSEMTLPEDNSQIFASKYETVLPSKEILQKLIDEQFSNSDEAGDDDYS